MSTTRTRRVETSNSLKQLKDALDLAQGRAVPPGFHTVPEIIKGTKVKKEAAAYVLKGLADIGAIDRVYMQGRGRMLYYKVKPGFLEKITRYHQSQNYNEKQRKS